MSTRLIAGLQPVREAIRAHGERLDRVVVDGARGAPHLDALARFATGHGVKVERVTRSDLDRMAKGAQHQGALAFAADLAIVSVDDLSFDERTLIVALDEVQDPQNFGAVIRSAVAMGATGVMLSLIHI